MTGEQILWLAALVVFVIAEAATVQLVSVWFACGALVALVAALLHAPLWLQIVLFLVVSAIALAATRPLVKKSLAKSYRPTNADRVLGKACYVTEKIDNIAGSGEVSASGKMWTARSSTGEIIEKGALVRPVSIEGVKLIVVPINTNDTKEEE